MPTSFDPCRSGLALLALACVMAAAPVAAGAAAPDLPEPRWRAFQTGALRPDRLQHATLAFSIGLGAGIAGGEPCAAFAIPAGLGLLKELADRRRDRFDWADLAADLAGAGLAALAIQRLAR
jgi:hypothetical protein